MSDKRRSRRETVGLAARLRSATAVGASERRRSERRRSEWASEGYIAEGNIAGSI